MQSILFPCEILSLHEVDSSFQNEYEAALEAGGFQIYLYDYEEFVRNGTLRLNWTPEEKILTVLRGWMLNGSQYEKFYNLLLERNLEATYYVLNKDYSELIPQDNPPSKPLIPQDNPVGTDVIPQDLRERIDNLGQRAKKDVVKQIILDLCKLKPRTKKEFAEILGKREDHIQKEYLSEMLGKEIEYTLPDTPSSRNQAYKVITEDK